MGKIQRITPIPLESIKDRAQAEMVLRGLNLKSDDVLDVLTSRVADIIEDEAAQPVYQEALKDAILSLISRLEVPVWLGLFKGRIASMLVSFLLTNAPKLLADFLRGLGKK